MKTQLALCFFIAALAPQAAHAETWWLLIGGRNGGRYESSSSVTQIPTNSYEECKQGGDKIINSKEAPNDMHGKIYEHIRYVCIQGK